MKDKKLNDSSRLLLVEAINAGITSPKELANLMGNADVETGGFTKYLRYFQTYPVPLDTFERTNRQFEASGNRSECRQTGYVQISSIC